MGWIEPRVGDIVRVNSLVPVHIGVVTDIDDRAERPGVSVTFAAGDTCYATHHECIVIGHVALVPVVREALAAAWDDGYDVGYADRANRDTTVPMPSNPWREDQP